MTDIQTLTQDFVAAIKQRDSLPFNAPGWEAENEKADKIIQEAIQKGILEKFSNTVSQSHHWL
ncbi:MAG: hypothetical protein QNJ68_07910 [Microcoleaceae cyanobacterium MO_207.B10]|nr:hypothetical protein [Microcoleaceae cyanobacterium MO_207.B10]